MLDDNKGPTHEPYYCKTEEHTVGTYEEAKELADKLFSPYLLNEAEGDRTSTKAKVRIRCKPIAHSFKNSYRVILYKPIQTKSKDKEPEHANADGSPEDNAPEVPESGGTKEKSAKRKARERSADRKAKRRKA